MIDIKKTNPTIRMLDDYIQSKEMTFDNPVQRGLIWNRNRKSYLIHSIIFGYPIPPIYANKSNGIYDVIDGKQRATAINQFLHDEFALSEIPPIKLRDGNIVDLSGRKFSKLNDDPEINKKLQDTLLSYNLDLHYGEDLAQPEIKDLFLRLNNGRVLSATELTKAQTKSISSLKELANHHLFNLIMDDRSIQASKNIGYVMQTYVIMFGDDMCLLNRRIKPLFSGTEITEDQVESLKKCYDYYETVLKTLEKEKSDISKRIMLVLKRKVHFVSVFKAVEIAVEDNIRVDHFVKWLKSFFDAKLGAMTISKEYNDNLMSGINSASSVQARLDAVESSLKSFR